MCGIVGWIGPRDGCGDDVLLRMMTVIAHRGPDGRGSERIPFGDREVLLGHLRLAILDLSDAGKQPMRSSDGRHVLIFNGEIYNYVELREELSLDGAVFVTRSDTEVVLEALRRWGTSAFSRFNGMWALAWLDLDAKRLLLSRDRFGKKPLYIHRSNGRMFFASEIKAILEGSKGRFRVNGHVAARFLRQGLLDATNETFFEGIEQLPAGHAMTIELAGADAAFHEPHPYWKLPPDPSADLSLDAFREAVRATFVDAVKLRLRSDVPVGVLLSGGVDSSAIAAAMKAQIQEGQPMHILSAVSDDPRYDESFFIDVMAAHLGVRPDKVRLDFGPREAMDLARVVTFQNDEPIGSFSYVAHYLLMKRARELGVTVILSGQGADESLCGYRKYLGFYVQELLRARRFFEAARLLAGFARNGTVLSQFDLADAKRYLPAPIKRAAVDIRGPALRETTGAVAVGLGTGGVIDRQERDLYNFSVPALCHYEDRMAMAFGREIRLPFLDYRFVSLLLRARVDRKLRDGWTKWIFREAMAPLLPEAIAWRKDKKGFSNPEGEWLRTSLQGEVWSHFGDDMVTGRLGLVDPRALRARYTQYLRTGPSWNVSVKEIFAPLALEIWARRFEGWLTT